jgi:general stress protein YciG
MKALKNLSDKASEYLDKKGLANPAEVVNEALGGETREESKKRREEAKSLKDREQTKNMRKPTMDENWYQDYARKLSATPADENKSKYTRDLGKKMFKNEVPNEVKDYEAYKDAGFKKGGMVRSSASKRADGCATKGKTKGRMV